MSRSSAERFRKFKATLKLEENKLLLQKFRDKDAAAHRKTRRIIKKDPEKMTKIREKNRARQAKPAKHGIISKPLSRPPSNTLSDITKNNVIDFYQLDEISTVAPGKKDVVVLELPDGSKIQNQKRYLVMTVREAYEQFRLAYPNEKIGSTSFSLLRPKHVLPVCNISQNVCLCKYHTNVDLLLLCLNPILNTPRTTKMLREALVCNSDDERCMSLSCETCGDMKRFDEVFKRNDTDGTTNLSYFQWEKSDSRIMKVEKTGTIQDAINELKNQTPTFLMHSFITHVQYMHFEKCKEDANPSSLVLQVDFSENYRTVNQNEIQNAFFNYNQVGLFNGVVWFGSGSEPICYSLACDDVSHDKYSIHVCLTKIIVDLKKKFSSLKIINIFSDGAGSQFKQRFSFANLTYLSNDHDLQLIWNFFASGHGRGAVDGVGGSVKRLVWKGVMTNQCIIRNAKDFVLYATEAAKHINIVLIDVKYIMSQRSLLDQRWDKVRSIPHTLKVHYVKALSLYNVKVKPFAKSNDKKIFCLKP